MKQTKIRLLNGTYTPAEAREMLSNSVKNELAYQKLQNYCSQVRYDENCHRAADNINRLSSALDDIRRLVQEANREGYEISVETVIQVSFVREAVAEPVAAF